jgi:hypothetical protein
MIKYDLITHDGFRRGKIRSLKAKSNNRVEVEAIIALNVHVKFSGDRIVCDAKDYVNIRHELETSKIDKGVKVGEEAEFKLDSLNRPIQIRVPM